MGLPPTSEYRGMAAAFPTPFSEANMRTLQDYRQNIIYYNRENIVYREPDGDQDIVAAVYRRDYRPHAEIFRTGFSPRERGSTSLEDYYNLEVHVNSREAAVDSSPVDGSIFVSTTRSTSWRPRVRTNTIIYRYQIFAPGGIDTMRTLGAAIPYPNQQEIAFAGGIDRQYIRTARSYLVLGHEGQYPTYTPYENRIYRNGNFNPNPTLNGQTTQEFMNRLRNTSCPNRDEFMINVVFTSHVRKGDIEDEPSPTEEPYIDPVCNVGHYVDCAFNFNHDREEAFIFMGDRCLQFNYASGTTDDYIVKGPMSIADFFPSLIDTIFASGIDAAFTFSVTNEVYIFRSNIYALINFVSGDIIGGPKKITDGFYSLKNTIFEHGIETAFASTEYNEAYIFKGDQYACINFAPGTMNDYFVTPPKKITLGFPSLKGTVFQDGLDAAFQAKTNEAYIFKGDTYALINYAPHTTDDRIINRVTPISNGFHSLKGIIPWYPCGC